MSKELEVIAVFRVSFAGALVHNRITSLWARGVTVNALGT